MNTKNLTAIVVGLGVSLVLMGCERDSSVRTYKTEKDQNQRLVPVAQKDTAAPTRMAMAQTPAGEQTLQLPISFKVPADWKLLGGDRMTAAVFQAGNDPSVRATVTPLGPASGSVPQNVNRWEQQLGLPPTPEANLSKVVTTVKIDGADSTMVDLVGPKGADGAQMRMLAAIVPTKDAVWYFKMAGPNDKVGASKAEFEGFVKSITFKPSTLTMPAQANTAGNPHAGGDPHAGMKMPGGTDPHAGIKDPHAGIKMPGGTDPHAGIKDPHAGMKDPHAGIPMSRPAGEANKLEGIASYKLPAGWKLDPTPRMMRVGTILVGDGDARAELAISRLGSFGEPLANLNRWRGQVGLAPVNDAKSVTPQTVQLEKGPVALYDFEGPADAGAGRKRMLVAQTQFKDAPETWFFRMAGPHATVTSAKADFEAFVKSLKFE